MKICCIHMMNFSLCKNIEGNETWLMRKVFNSLHQSDISVTQTMLVSVCDLFQLSFPE